MIIKLADHYGLCFGVRDAIAQAEQHAQAAPLTILGELVHNPVVRRRLQHHGARDGDLGEVASAATAQVMITAHGAADRDRQRWTDAGFQVRDGTCPLVRKAHDTLRTLVAAGYAPVVIGQRGHAEVRGLTGDFPGATVLETVADLANLPAAARYGVISQTTQPLERVEALVEQLRAARPDSEVRFCDTVCRPTKERQAALRRLLAEVEVIVVVGGRNSNNTRELVSAVQTAGKTAHHVEQAADLQEGWFAGVSSVGITAGTSTLRETVAAVQARLEGWARPRCAAPARLRPSAEWTAYFRQNAKELRPLPWALGAEATAAELREIIPSLRAWQLGETSDGAHLLASAQRYARQIGDPEFVEAVRLFTVEEQRHGETLGLFLDLAGFTRARHNWGDSLFRTVRHLWTSMEVWVTPVVMVETHAMVYYRAIRRATGSPLLREICAQILADEVAHIRFQCERLAILHGRCTPWRRRLTQLLHRPAFAAMTLLIWAAHRRALRAGGYTLGTYWRSVWGRMRYAWRRMDPAVYARE